MTLLAEFGLPRRLLIRCYNDITLTFTGTATSLTTIWEQTLQKGYKLGDMPEAWARYWHLADQYYLQGGGWICIEENTGRLVVIDLDIPTPVYLLNASVQHFYTTLANLLEWTERTGGDSIAIPGLRDSLLKQRVVPPDELEPFWMNIVYATIDCGDPTDLRVELLA